VVSSLQGDCTLAELNGGRGSNLASAAAEAVFVTLDGFAQRAYTRARGDVDDRPFALKHDASD
jgi:hypothetical protein